MTAYYNEIEPYAAQWLRNLIAKNLIAKGEVDERSIKKVSASDLKGFAQCHFFAGIGGWSYALRLAGWPDARPVWTGSCPCQPFSQAGKKKGAADERHLWPDWFCLIRKRIPSVIFGEQVARAVGDAWLDAVANDLEKENYALGAAVLPACSIGSPHMRERIWFVADALRERPHKKSKRVAKCERSSEFNRNGALRPLADTNGNKRDGGSGLLQMGGGGKRRGQSSRQCSAPGN